MSRILIPSGVMPTAGPMATIALPAATAKTVLQARLTNLARLVEWGVSFDGYSAVTPVKAELIETGTVFATVTQLTDSDIHKLDRVADAAAPSVMGLTVSSTTGTGFDAGAEGTVTSSRLLDPPILLPPTAPFVKQFLLGFEPVLQVGKSIRIRLTAPNAVNVYAYMILEI